MSPVKDVARKKYTKKLAKIITFHIYRWLVITTCGIDDALKIDFSYC